MLRFLLLLLFTNIAFTGELYENLIKEIPVEYKYNFRSVEDPNSYHIIEETLVKVDDSKIVLIPDSVWKERNKARLFLEKHKSDLNFLNKVSQMDYALPEKHKFTVSAGKFSYLRFLFKLKALELKFGGNQEIRDALQCIEFTKKYGQQSDSSIRFLVLLACQRIIYKEIEQKKLDKASSRRLKKSLLNKRDYSIALKAELYITATILEMFSKDSNVDKMNFEKIHEKLIINAALAIGYFEGRVDKEEILERVNSFGEKTYKLEEANKNPEALIHLISFPFLSEGIFKLEKKLTSWK